MERRDDPRRHRRADAERIADGDHPIADARALGIAELDVRERAAFDLQHGKIGGIVMADQLGLIFLAVGHRHGDLIDRRALRARGNHMVVGDDIAIGGNDEARAERFRLARRRPAALAAIHLPEQVAERRAGERIGGHLHMLRGRDVDHRRLQPSDHVRKAHRRAGARRHLLDRARFVLRLLRASRRLQGHGGGRATEEKGAGNAVSVTH